MTGEAEIACAELVDLATDYLEGVLSPHELALLEEHLAVCEGCGAYVEQLRETVHLARDPRRVELNPVRRAALLAAFRAATAGE